MERLLRAISEPGTRRAVGGVVAAAVVAGFTNLVLAGLAAGALVLFLASKK